jgi:hypothetical protein
MSINNDDIDMLKKYIKINNCIKILLTDKFNLGNNKLLIDPNYKTEYYESTFLKNTFQKINISYNQNNTYSNINPLFVSEKPVNNIA